MESWGAIRGGSRKFDFVPRLDDGSIIPPTDIAEIVFMGKRSLNDADSAAVFKLTKTGNDVKYLTTGQVPTDPVLDAYDGARRDGWRVVLLYSHLAALALTDLPLTLYAEFQFTDSAGLIWKPEKARGMLYVDTPVVSVQP